MIIGLLLNIFHCMGGGESYSQFGQDRFILNMIFARKRNGTFLDIGGNHPIKMNNTYMFEKHGWTGYAFEPQKEIVELWKTTRNTECFNVAVGDVDKMIKFGRITENDEKRSSELRFYFLGLFLL